jgi:hypothetical protein
MSSLPELIARRSTALFVATGSSNERVRDWLRHFDTVATHNQAVLAVPGPIDYATFLSSDMALLCQGEFQRIKCFLCSLPFGRQPWDFGIPADRAVTFDRGPGGIARASADRCIGETDTIWMGEGAACTIHLLAKLGLQWVFCLGHSDRDGKVPEAYVRSRTACEVAADAVEKRHGCRVVFWMPEHTPENWRTHQKRGFLFAR